MLSSTVNGITTHMETQALESIFGYQPRIGFTSNVGNIAFVGGKMVTLNGSFLDIITKEDVKYTIANEQFTKIVNKTVISGSAYFAGPWDEAGQKIANLYFANVPANSVVYLNDTQKQLVRNSDGIIQLL